MSDTALLDALRRFDTPTICNALEAAGGSVYNAAGYTRRPLLAARPRLAPIVGFARTARIRATEALSADDKRARALRWYEHCASGPKPSVVVVQDIDPEPAVGALWGEVNSNVLKGLGALGAVTDGAFRDVDALAEGFQLIGRALSPSHAFVHIVDVGTPVDICGMAVADGDLIHADRHGAVRIPTELLAKLPDAIALLSKRERLIIDAARRPDFSLDSLRQAFADSADIH